MVRQFAILMEAFEEGAQTYFIVKQRWLQFLSFSIMQVSVVLILN